MPAAESATIALASLQFARGEVDGSTAMIDNVFEHAIRGDDPGRLAGYGLYMYWPEIKAAMRAELRQ